HSDLMRSTVFSDFDALWPGKFVNITNGITPRRWLHHANQGLSALITEHIGRGWISDLNQLRRLVPHSGHLEFQSRFLAVKRQNKQRLARLIQERTGVTVNVESMFDV